MSVKRETLCLNCGRLGHHSNNCSREQRCLKCAGKHDKSKCKERSAKCINCREPHETTSTKCRSQTNIRKRNSEARKKDILKKAGLTTEYKELPDYKEEVDRLVRNELKYLKKKLRRKSNKNLSKLNLSYLFIPKNVVQNKNAIQKHKINKNKQLKNKNLAPNIGINKLDLISKLTWGLIITKIDNSVPKGTFKIINLVLKNLDYKSYYSKTKKQIRLWFENETDRDILIKTHKLGKLGKKTNCN